MKSSVGVNLDATGGAITDQIVYTVPTGYRSTISLFWMSNVGGTSTTVGGKWSDGADITFMSGKSLNAGDHIEFGGPYGAWLSMDEGDTLKASVANGGVCGLIISYELVRKGMN